MLCSTQVGTSQHHTSLDLTMCTWALFIDHRIERYDTVLTWGYID